MLNEIRKADARRKDEEASRMIWDFDVERGNDTDIYRGNPVQFKVMRKLSSRFGYSTGENRFHT